MLNIDIKQKKNMLRINSNTKSIPRLEGQMTELGFNFEGRDCSPVKVTIECYVDAEQLNDFDGNANEVVFQLKMPHYKMNVNYNVNDRSGEVILTKSDLENILDFNHY